MTRANNLNFAQECGSEDAPVFNLPDGSRISLKFTTAFPVTAYTRFMLENMPTVAGKAVLDFGTGCGALAIAAAKLGAASIAACDISDDALNLTRLNAQLNGIAEIRVFGALQPGHEHDQLPTGAFDIIISNPASLPTIGPEDTFSSGGPDGTSMIRRLIEVASWALRPSGSLHFLHTSLAPLQATLGILASHGFSAGIESVQALPFRPHYDSLLPHLIALRHEGSIHFRGEHGGPYQELLYMIEAQRFSQHRGA